MAYTGTGTQSDPYIVDNWEDCVSIATITGAYIKWADAESKTIDFGGEPITQITDYNFNEIDFNGWEFKNFTFGESNGIFYNVGNLEHDVTIKNATFTGQMIASQLGNGTWGGFNPIAYFMPTDTERFYVNKVYFNIDCVYSDLAKPSYTFFNGRTWADDITPYKLYTSSITINASVFNITVHNRCNLIFTSCELTNCEVLINGHLADTTTNALRFGSVLFLLPSRSGIRSGCGMDNCYLNVQVTSDTDIDFALTPSHINNCIFDLKNSALNSFTNENNPSYYIYCQNYENWVENAKITPNYVLLNALTTTITISNALNIISTDDITNIRQLRNNGFSLLPDDNVRYLQYEEGNLENWSFRIDPTVNDSIPFLPFWKYSLSPWGAFYNAIDLQSIVIPKTVRVIGEYAFRNTALKEVTISSGCAYSETSFPDDCVVNFYDD